MSLSIPGHPASGLHKPRTPAGNSPVAGSFLQRGAGVLLSGLILVGTASADILTGLQGYYSFETETGGTTPNAARGLGRPGFENDGARLLGGESSATPSVPLSTAPGTFRAGASALACDGNGDYADLPVNPVVMDQDFTVSVWFKPQTGGAGVTGTVRSFVMESKPAFSISFGLRASATGFTAFQMFSDTAAADPNQIHEMPNEEVDDWHHFVCTYLAETGEMLGYLNGELLYQLALPEPPMEITGFNTGTYRNGDGRWFRGFIDEQVFWQRALTAEETGTLFAAGNAEKSFAALSSEAANTGLRTGLTAYYSFESETDRQMINDALTLGAPGFAGDDITLVGEYSASGTTVPPLTNSAAEARAGTRALLLDGTDNHAVIDGNPVDQSLSFTVAAWFKPATEGLGYDSPAARGFIYETGVNYPVSFGLRGGAAPGETNFQLYSHLNTNAGIFADYTVPTADLDQWHHFLQTYDAATGVITGYLDGVATHTLNTEAEGFPVPLQTYSGFRLGTYRGADGRWFRGLIDEVGMWQRSLTPEEARTVYTLGKAGLALSENTDGPVVTGFSPVAGTPGIWQITWTTTAGLKYAVEASSDLKDWSTTLADEVSATAATLSFQIVPSLPAPAGSLYDPGAAAGGRRFYRVRVKF